jgi:hypothetical protein
MQKKQLVNDLLKMSVDNYSDLIEICEFESGGPLTESCGLSYYFLTVSPVFVSAIFVFPSHKNSVYI